MTPPESPDAPLAGASESSSSKKITQGRANLAYKSTNSLRKVAPVCKKTQLELDVLRS